MTDIRTLQNQNECLTMVVDSFCQRVGISRSTFYSEVRAGKIRTLKVGAKTLLSVTEPTRYLELLAAEAATRKSRHRDARSAA